MFTSIRALEDVYGAAVLLIGCVLCLILAFTTVFAVKTNRGKGSVPVSVLGILIPAILCDLLWYQIYFPDGEYRNLGLASAAYVVLYPFFLAVGVTIATIINKLRKKA